MAKKKVEELKNTDDVWDVVAETIMDLKKGHISVPVAKQIINGAGKLFNKGKTDLEFAVVKKKYPDITIPVLEHRGRTDG